MARYIILGFLVCFLLQVSQARPDHHHSDLDPMEEEAVAVEPDTPEEPHERSVPLADEEMQEDPKTPSLPLEGHVLGVLTPSKDPEGRILFQPLFSTSFPNPLNILNDIKLSLLQSIFRPQGSTLSSLQELLENLNNRVEMLENGEDTTDSSII